jgi:hypothetical protein
MQSSQVLMCFEMTMVRFDKNYSLFKNKISKYDFDHVNFCEFTLIFRKISAMSKNLPSILQSALKSFRLAENEMNRPGEDVVAYCACHNMRESVNIFLLSYLASKLVQLPGESKFNDLLSYCKKLDPQFKAINLSCVDCRNNGMTNTDSHYCFSTKKINQCFMQAKMVKNLVLAKMEISEKDLELLLT